jgi:hypothetical protein
MIRNAVGTIQLKITNMCTIKAKCTNDNNLRTFTTKHVQDSIMDARKTTERASVQHVWCNTQSINIQDHGNMIVTRENDIINMLANKP